MWPNGWTDHDATGYGCTGLGPGHIVLDGDPASPHGKRHSTPQLSRFTEDAYKPVSVQTAAHVYCGQSLVAKTAGCIRMPLGTEVGLGYGDIVLDGDPAPATERDTTALHFSAHNDKNVKL